MTTYVVLLRLYSLSPQRLYCAKSRYEEKANVSDVASATQCRNADGLTDGEQTDERAHKDDQVSREIVVVVLVVTVPCIIIIIVDIVRRQEACPRRHIDVVA